jgi:uncharacterized membrane protein
VKPIMWIGILLIVLGVLSLAYQEIHYTSHESVMDVGPMHVTKESRERIPLPPILGGLALIGGVALVIKGARQK